MTSLPHLAYHMTLRKGKQSLFPLFLLITSSLCSMYRLALMYSFIDMGIMVNIQY